VEGCIIGPVETLWMGAVGPSREDVEGRSRGPVETMWKGAEGAQWRGCGKKQRGPSFRQCPDFWLEGPSRMAKKNSVTTADLSMESAEHAEGALTSPCLSMFLTYYDRAKSI
jgi:hypothetical protein